MWVPWKATQRATVTAATSVRAAGMGHVSDLPSRKSLQWGCKELSASALPWGRQQWPRTAGGEGLAISAQYRTPPRVIFPLEHPVGWWRHPQMCNSARGTPAQPCFSPPLSPPPLPSLSQESAWHCGTEVWRLSWLSCFILLYLSQDLPPNKACEPLTPAQLLLPGELKWHRGNLWKMIKNWNLGPGNWVSIETEWIGYLFSPTPFFFFANLVVYFLFPCTFNHQHSICHFLHISRGLYWTCFHIIVHIESWQIYYWNTFVRCIFTILP